MSGFLFSVYALRISWLCDEQWAILSANVHQLKFKVQESTLMEEASVAFTCPFCQNANLLWLCSQSLFCHLPCGFLWLETSQYPYFLGTWSGQMDVWFSFQFFLFWWGSWCFFWWGGSGLDIPESEPLVKDFLATINDLVGGIKFEILTEDFPSSAIFIVIWYW